MSRPDPLIGRVLRGTIEIRRLIGKGGMGAVYEGYQSHLDRRVAVKVMTPEHARNPIAAEYFIREARQSSALRHPNIIQIIDFGQEEDVLFMAMEFVPGVPLSSLMREQRLSDERISKIMQQVLSALEEAHAKGIVHRDLKPDNIMVEQTRDGDFVKILDFGIAQSKASQPAGPLTQAGALVGTPNYMSPEQAEGKDIDGRSDLFSMGIILYELLTKKLPFRGDSVPRILIEVIQKDPPAPATLNPDVNPLLEVICKRALEKNRELRYQSATEFRQAFLGETQKKAEPAAQFIFKRKPRTSPRITNDETIQLSKHTEDLANDSSEVVDTNRLFDTETRSAPVSAPEPSVSRFGVDLNDLKKDLVGERQSVCSLVIQHRAITREDPEVMADARDLLENITRSVAERWGGLVQGRSGAFITVLFGTEIYDPQAAVKASQAAMDLRGNLKRNLPDFLEFGLGIDAGELYVPGLDWSKASGESLDTAFELAQGAHASEIRVAASIVPLLESFYKLGDSRDGARSILGLSDAEALDRNESFEGLVGRDIQVAGVLAFVSEVARGKGGVLLMQGAAGMGKSAMLHEAGRMAQERGGLVFKAWSKYEGAQEVRNILAQWIRAIARYHGRSKDIDVLGQELGMTPESARLLRAFVENRLAEATSGLSNQQLDDGASSLQAVDAAFRQLLKGQAKRRLPLLQLDEVHDLSPELKTWLERFSRTIADQNIGLMVGFRSKHPEEVDFARTIYLEALEDSASRAILKVNLPVEVGAALRAELVKLAAGVPLHLMELIRIVKSKKAMTLEEAQAHLSKAPDVRTSLLTRLYDLEKPAQNLMALLAVLGNQTRGDVLLEIALEAWQPEQELEKLWRSGLLSIEGESEEPEIFFNPPVFGDVVYEQMSLKMRAQVHQRASDYFEGRLSTEKNTALKRHWRLKAAHHLLAAGRSDDALTRLEEVLRDAEFGHEYEVAVDVIKSIKKLLHQSPRRFEFTLKEVRLLEALGRTREAIQIALALDKEDCSPHVQIGTKWELARLWLKEQDPDPVERMLKKALIDARRMAHENPSVDSLALLIRGLQLLAAAQERGQKFQQAADTLLEAIELTERHQIPSTTDWGARLLWEPLNQLGRIRLRLKELPGAESLFELAMRAALDSNDRRGVMQVKANSSVLLTEQNRVDAAIRTLQDALKIARELNDLQTLAQLRHNEGLMALKQRRRDRAEEAFNESLQISESLDFREGIGLNVKALTMLREK